MELSVVIPTLNGREWLAGSLESVAEYAPEAETVVVNGPSADGTTGMVRSRDDVDVLVEISDRNVNVARNAGIDTATGDVVAFLGYDFRLGPDWVDELAAGLDEAEVVTGPLRQTVRGGATSAEPERTQITGREITYFNGKNSAFRRRVLEDLDGFDEYLLTGGSRDAAHRLAALGIDVAWRPRMGVRQEVGADGGRPHPRPEGTGAEDPATDARDWGWKYRALAYRLVKNYGFRPTVVARALIHAGIDAAGAARGVLRGTSTPTSWAHTGREVISGISTGASDGWVARSRDRSPRRNPHGISARADRAVGMYDWR